MITQADFLENILTYFAICASISFVLGAVLLIISFRSVRRLNIPENADLTTTLLAVPFFVVLGIDLLDLALDVLAVPIVWVVLDRMKLRALRNMSSIEALIPLTGPIPTMTIAWVLVRMGLRL